MSLLSEIGEVGLDTIRESFNSSEQSLERIWIFISHIYGGENRANMELKG